MNARRSIAATILAALLAGCGAATPSAAPNGIAMQQPASSPVAARRKRHKGVLHFRILIPKRKKHRHAHFISPATVQMKLKFTGPTPIDVTVALTPSSPGCSSSLAGTVCEFSETLLAGHYTAAISTFDASANELSTAQAVPVTIVEGLINQAGVTLSGVPFGLIVVAQDAASAADGNGFDLLGIGAHRFLVEALDADSNPIVGSGAPSLAVTASGGGSLVLTVAGPTASHPNSFTVTPPTTFSTATQNLNVVASYPAGVTNGCAVTNAECTATVPLDMRELLLVGSTGAGVSEYAVGSTTPVLTVAASVATTSAVAADSNGNVYVAYPTQVLEFAPGSDSAKRTLSSGINSPCCLAIDATNDLFVGNTTGGAGSGHVDVYPTTGTTPTTSVTNGIDVPAALAIDGSANLLVANGTGGVGIYASPYTAAPTGLAPGVAPCTPSSSPAALAINGAQVLFVALAGPNAFCGWDSGYGAAPGLTDSSGIGGPIAMALDTSNDLFVANTTTNGGSGSVTEYLSPGYSGAPNETITNGIDGPQSIAVDASGNLYVANVAGNAVTVYQPGSTVPFQTISINGPTAVAIEP